MTMLAMVCSKGVSAWQGQQFSLSDVEVVAATVNLDAINTYRGGSSSLQEQASSAPSYPQIQVSKP